MDADAEAEVEADDEGGIVAASSGGFGSGGVLRSAVLMLVLVRVLSAAGRRKVEQYSVWIWLG